MSRWLTSLFGLALLCGSLGCQCSRFAPCYYNVVDEISDHECRAEKFYHARWDVSRIGMPDWCENRRCQKCCQSQCCRGKQGCCHQVYYPAEYTLQYQQQLAEQQLKEARRETVQGETPSLDPSADAPPVEEPVETGSDQSPPLLEQ